MWVIHVGNTCETTCMHTSTPQTKRYMYAILTSSKLTDLTSIEKCGGACASELVGELVGETIHPYYLMYLQVRVRALLCGMGHMRDCMRRANPRYQVRRWITTKPPGAHDDATVLPPRKPLQVVVDTAAMCVEPTMVTA